MSYSSRVRRQRNNQHSEDAKQKVASSQSQQPGKKEASKKNIPADSYGQQAGFVNKKEASKIQRLATAADEEKASTNDARMKNDKDIQEKPIQLKEDSADEMDPVQTKSSPDEQKEKEVQKAPDKNKEEKSLQKKGDEGERKPVQKSEEPQKDEKPGEES